MSRIGHDLLSASGAVMESQIRGRDMPKLECVPLCAAITDLRMMHLAYRLDVSLDDMVLVFDELFKCSATEWRRVSTRPKNIKSSVSSNAVAIH